jgi:hypothetical protein
VLLWPCHSSLFSSCLQFSCCCWPWQHQSQANQTASHLLLELLCQVLVMLLPQLPVHLQQSCQPLYQQQHQAAVHQNWQHQTAWVMLLVTLQRPCCCCCCHHPALLLLLLLPPAAGLSASQHAAAQWLCSPAASQHSTAQLQHKATFSQDWIRYIRACSSGMQSA